MANEIDVVETSSSIFEKGDIYVNIVVKKPYIPGTMKATKISVYGTKSNGNGTLEGVEIDETDTTNKNKMGDDDKKELNFVGSISLWNVATLTQAHVDKMIEYGDTLVVLSSKSSEVKTNGSSLKFGNLIIWLTETAAKTTMKDFVRLDNRGVFLDKEKEGKCLYAVSTLVQYPRMIKHTTQIRSSTFKGIASKETAKSLSDLGYSFFFKAIDGCWARGFWLGGGQARVNYMERVLIFDVKQKLAEYIDKGVDLTETTIIEIDLILNKVVSTHPYVTDLLNVFVPAQQSSDVAKGTLSGITVTYRIAKELRTINLTMEGVV